VMTRPLGTLWKFRPALALEFAILLLAASAMAQTPQQEPQTQPQQQQPTAQQQQQTQQQQPPATTTPTQGQSPSTQKPATDKTADTPDKPAQKDDRIFGVMPNHLTINGTTKIDPLTWKGKFKITAEGAFDPYEFVVVGVISGIHQAENTDPPFGQGMEGYAKRYGTGFADQAIGNMMTGAVFPSILRTDPRYFRLGEGSIGHRMGYSISRIFVTRTDSGHTVFNLSEFAGNGAAAGISNAYYPRQDRTISNNLNTWATQIAIDCFGNQLKEFWPDIHSLLRRKHTTSPDGAAPPSPHQ
jgi:hypothetical protein